MDEVELTTPRCDRVDVPDTDTDHTENIVAYIANSLRNRVGIQEWILVTTLTIALITPKVCCLLLLLV